MISSSTREVQKTLRSSNNESSTNSSSLDSNNSWIKNNDGTWS
ncbi:hypothetical protein AB2T71_16430 [Clostridium butyricum]|nr:hypothetical protein [Clostridium butyricum]